MAIEVYVIPVDSISFSNRCVSRERSAVSSVRCLVRSRRCRMGQGGMNEARTNPWAASSASHCASETSVLRPGRFFAWRALTRITFRSFLQTVEERLPIVAGCLHHHQGDFFSDEIVAQGLNIVVHGTVNGDLLAERVSALPWYSHADFCVSFGDIHSRASFVDEVHELLLPNSFEKGR